MDDSTTLVIFGAASSGLTMLLATGLVVVGLVYVRRESPIAGSSMVGAGIFAALGTALETLATLTFALFPNVTVLVVSHGLSIVASILSGLLLPVSIFLMAQSIKRRT